MQRPDAAPVPYGQEVVIRSHLKGRRGGGHAAPAQQENAAGGRGDGLSGGGGDARPGGITTGGGRAFEALDGHSPAVDEDNDEEYDEYSPRPSEAAAAQTEQSLQQR